MYVAVLTIYLYITTACEVRQSLLITNKFIIATPFMPQVEGYQQKVKAKTKRLWFKIKFHKSSSSSFIGVFVIIWHANLLKWNRTKFKWDLKQAVREVIEISCSNRNLEKILMMVSGYFKNWSFWALIYIL